MGSSTVAGFPAVPPLPFGADNHPVPEGERAAHAAFRIAAAARRLDSVLHTHRTIVQPEWADRLRADLDWLGTVLTREHIVANRLALLLAALHRLTDAGAGEGRTTSALTAGAARAGALLERRLTLGKAKAHSAALRAVGSARFHAVADAVAVVASESPPRSAAGHRVPAAALFSASAGVATGRRLAGAVTALTPPHPAGCTLPRDTSVVRADEDRAWHRARDLLRAHRYAREVTDSLERSCSESVGESDEAGRRLNAAARVLDRHHDAAQAAACAAEAAEIPRIAPATAYALGVLHADQRHEVAAARCAFSHLWIGGAADMRGARCSGEAADSWDDATGR